MTDGPVESNSGTTAVATPPEGQATLTTPETPSQSGQAASQAQSAPAEEQFSNIDPETLPPELQGVYKNLQSDYTKKTQAIADTRKKAEAYDKIAADQRFVEYWNGLSKKQKADFEEQKQEAEKKLGEKVSDEEFAKAFQSKDDFLSFLENVVQTKTEKAQKKIDELEQFKVVTDASNIVSAFATEQGTDGKLLRPDFYALDEDQLITGFLSINPPDDRSQQAYIKRLNDAYGWAKATTQKYYEKGKAEALQIIQKKATNSTNPPTNAAKGAYTGPDPKKMSVREAMELAKKGIKVPQVYD